jgi:hypothetical protein
MPLNSHNDRSIVLSTRVDQVDEPVLSSDLVVVIQKSGAAQSNLSYAMFPIGYRLKGMLSAAVEHKSVRGPIFRGASSSAPPR